MAAPTITAVTKTANRCVFKVVADNTGTAGLIASSVILAAMAPGPLKDAWTKAYANQAAMRTALEGGNCKLTWAPYTGLALVQPDVDVDAVTATRAEINITISAATVEGYLEIEHAHTFVR